MAQRQIVISLGRDTAVRAGVNVLTGDSGETLLSNPVDINDVVITGVAFEYVQRPHVNAFFDHPDDDHVAAAAAIDWLDDDAARTKTGPTSDSSNALSIIATGLGAAASFEIVTQHGFDSQTLGTLSVNDQTTGEIDLNFNSTDPSAANYVGAPASFSNVAANNDDEHVLTITSESNPKWNAMLVTFDDTHLVAVNNPASGLPSITGTAQTGQTVTADTSSITDADGLGSFTYQWNRNGSPISGETGSTYVLVVADESQSITVDVSFTDGEGNAEGPLTSTAITPSAPAANNAPVGVDDTATTDEDTSVNIDILANDSDADSDTLSVTAASASNGTVIIETDNTLTYTPNSGFTGSDTISYTVSDGTDTDTASVTVTVNEVVSGLTPPIGNPSAQSQLIDEILVAGPSFNGIAAANPGLDLVGLGAFAEVITGTPIYDLATGSWETLAADTEWDVYVYNGQWSAASRVSASAGQSSADVGGGSVVTSMSVVSADSTMQRGTNYQVTIQDAPITPTTSNTSLVSGNDSLVCTLVEDLGNAQYRLTFTVGDLSKQVNTTGYNWSVRVENS